MKTLLVVLSALFAIAASATETPAAALDTANATPYKQFYLVGGKQVDTQTAIVEALGGRAAFKCVSVTAAVSKSGTSISVKNVKKPKKAN